MQTKSQKAKANLKNYARHIDGEIKKYFKKEIKRASEVSRPAKRMLTVAEDFILRGGKRLRGSFVYYSYKLLKNTKLKEIDKAAVAIELVHGYLLAIDDYMDQDDIRRGGPTAHKMYEKLYAEDFKLTPELRSLIGISMATGIGCIMAHQSAELIQSMKVPEKIRIKALDKVHRTLINVWHGQELDLITWLKKDVTEKDVLKVHTNKTAIYTYENPIHVGLLLGGAGKRELDIASKYAIPCGIAFQLQDDILGIFGTQEKIGKPVYSDIKEGKQSLLIIKAREFASKSDVKFLNRHLGNRKLTKAQGDKVKAIIEESGSLDYSKDLAKKLVLKGKKDSLHLMKRAGMRQEGIDYLEGIADYMIEREL